MSFPMCDVSFSTGVLSICLAYALGTIIGSPEAGTLIAVLYLYLMARR